MKRNCLRRYYHRGEKRLIEWSVVPNNELDTLVIVKATYEIFKSDKLVKNGNLDINKQKVGFNFIADEVGEFLIRIYITVPPETLSSELIATVEE